VANPIYWHLATETPSNSLKIASWGAPPFHP